MRLEEHKKGSLILKTVIKMECNLWKTACHIQTDARTHTHTHTHIHTSVHTTIKRIYIQTVSNMHVHTNTHDTLMHTYTWHNMHKCSTHVCNISKQKYTVVYAH